MGVHRAEVAHGRQPSTPAVAASVTQNTISIGAAERAGPCGAEDGGTGGAPNATAAVHPLPARPRHQSRAAWFKRWRAENPELNRAKNEKWKAANREKYLAHKAVEYAVRIGRLQKRPCERCGTNTQVHAHHDDYSRRLDVRWLCPIHHRDRHREMACEAAS